MGLLTTIATPMHPPPSCCSSRRRRRRRRYNSNRPRVTRPVSAILLLAIAACCCIILSKGITSAIEFSSLSPPAFPAAGRSPSFATKPTQQHVSSAVSSCGAFAFSLRNRNKQQSGESSNRNGNDAIIVVGDGEERQQTRQELVQESSGVVLVNNNHHQRRIDDDNGHNLIMNGSLKVDGSHQGHHPSDSGDYEIQYILGDMNDSGHRHQQQEQQKPVEKEHFHATSVNGTGPNQNVNSKPSLAIAHEEEEEEEQDDERLIVSEDNSLDSIMEGNNGTSSICAASTPMNTPLHSENNERQEGISTVTRNNDNRTAINRGDDDDGDDGDAEALWAKRNARSIDEGIRFKSQLRQGLEEQTKLHQARLRREQLLGNLLKGFIGGGNTNTTSAPLVNETANTKNGTNNWFRWRGSWNKGKRVYRGKELSAKSGKEASTRDAYEETDNFDTSAHNAAPDDKDKRNNLGARTIAGLVSAVATDPPEDLEVLVDADPSTPSRRKTVRSIKLYFTRLNTMQLHMGPIEDDTFEDKPSMIAKATGKFELAKSFFQFGKYKPPKTADEAFDTIDVDNSGTLDEEELAQALKTAAVVGGNAKIGSRSDESLKTLAKRMVELYDADGDGMVDREEYRRMVEDMASLREGRLREEEEELVQTGKDNQKENGIELEGKKGKKKWGGFSFSIFGGGKQGDTKNSSSTTSAADGQNNTDFLGALDQGEGSLVLEDLELDLRRLAFGAIPVVKRVAPGGPLILKPFTATLTCSFNADDIMSSILLDTGLRRLVARALSRRVTSLRDLLDGAIFYGRTWKQFQQSAPKVVVEKLEDVRFDKRNRLIVTGRARITEALGYQHEPIEQGFKLRTKIGTRAGGRIIGLLQPEIAIFAECPKGFERTVRTQCKDWFGYTIPTFKPLYAYIPLVSPLKKDDEMDGFNMGEDNQIKSIDIKNGKVRLSFCAFLRPGRFLGNHYLAFTFPNRTLILTLDRLREMMRNARRNRRLAQAAAREVQQLSNSQSGPYKENVHDIITQSNSGKSVSISPEGKVRMRQLGTQVETELKVPFFEDAILRAIKESADIDNDEKKGGKSFISRFVEGYSGAFRQELDLELNTRLSTSISDFFGSQDREDVGEDTDDKEL